METKFLFNYAPPAMLNMPAAAFSVLKSYLEAHGIGCKIHYWNFQLAKLQAEFLWQKNSDILADETNNLLLFFNYLAIKLNDSLTYNKLKGHLLGIKPQFVGRGQDIFDKHMKYYADQLDKLIDEVIDDVCSPQIQYYGFSANLYQWVCSSIIAAKIRLKYPKSVFILGGIGTEKAAVEFLKIFPQFDFALWGEGENALYSLVSNLEKGEDVCHISNMVYKREGRIELSNIRKVQFAELSSLNVRPDYCEYFSQKGTNDFVKGIDSAITIEASRGCHWNRCHFCYLNTGYRNRVKDVPMLIDEIRYNIQKYEIYQFNFLDNDIINNDYDRFDDLLNQLIGLKKEFPEFKIGMAEIITKGINADIIKKMSIAGFETVQIGYESLSNNILQKIEKKNSLASNFLFVKYAVFYNINLGGANIITGLLEETDEDIIESIQNLHLYRFYLNYGQFNHSQTRLAVCSASRYYKNIDIKSSEWVKNKMFDCFLPQKYLDSSMVSNIIGLFHRTENSLWENFKQVERHYLMNSYTYQLISYKSSICYRESFNRVLINELEFEADSMDWFILEKSNKEVISFDELLSLVRIRFGIDIMDIEIVNIIEDLKEEGLIYVSDDYTEIISLINVEMLL